MTTYEPSQPTLFAETELPLTPSAGVFRAKTLATLENELVSKVRDLVCGRNMPVSLASYDPASSSWKTSQACLVSGWEPFSETFPRSGMMLSGTVYQLQPLALFTAEIGSGSLLATPTRTANQLAPSMLKHPGCRAWWPTPRRQSANGPGLHGQGGMDLQTAVLIWPTPTQRIWKGGGKR